MPGRAVGHHRVECDGKDKQKNVLHAEGRPRSLKGLQKDVKRVILILQYVFVCFDWATACVVWLLLQTEDATVARGSSYWRATSSNSKQLGG